MKRSRSVSCEILRRVAARRSVNIAMHGVAAPRPDLDEHSHWRAPERFRADLELLLDAGFHFVTVAEIAERAAGGPSPPGLATLSFDDGMQDNHEHAWPILRELGLPATVYVITGLIGRSNPWMAPGSGARMMTEAELRELHAGGFEIGAHTVNHPDLRSVGYDACLDEMVRSKRALEDLLGASVKTFAYPYCLSDETVRRAARDAGFVAAVTCGEDGSRDDPFALWRAMITGRDGTATFALKAAGLYQPLWESLPGRAVRGATRTARQRLRARQAS